MFIFWAIIALTLAEVFILISIFLFFVRLRQSESTMNELQTNQEQMLERIQDNAIYEQELVSSFMERQRELGQLDKKLDDRAQELKRLLEQAEGILRSPHFLRELVLNSHKKGKTIKQIADSAGLDPDEVEMILAQNGIASKY